MRFAHFSELMKHAACIVGNSSAGVREAPFLGVPSLDVGTRQNARSVAPSITSVHATETDKIMDFLQMEWGRRYDNDAEFGQGAASEQFVNILQSDDFWSRGFQKVFQDDA
jgi:UDP-N-acetylglucosamine 2-epimerase (hydrolysing)